MNRALSKKQIMAIADKRNQVIEDTLAEIKDQIFMVITLLCADEDERKAIIADIMSAQLEEENAENNDIRNNSCDRDSKK